MTERDRTVLLVEDDDDHASLIAATLESIGLHCTRAASLADAFAVLSEGAFALVVLDYWLGNESSVAVLRWIRARGAAPPVLFVTAETDVAVGVEAMRLGAADYVVKSEGYLGRLRERIRECLASCPAPAAPRARAVGDDPRTLIGTSPKLDHVRKLIERAARSSDPVLITGETGVGKDLVAHAIHRASRPDTSFSAVNIPALSPSLFEAEMFGTARGAFTGAIERFGIVRTAEGGTLFLDEIGELSLEMQPKILRLIEQRTYCSVGSTRVIEADVRFIAATNRDLERAIAEGRFRADLFYRLDVNAIRVPPLRERVEDIPLIAETFVERYRDRTLPRPAVDRIAIARLMAHPWPGNVRELENVVRRALRAYEATGSFVVETVRDSTTGDPDTQDDGRITRERLVDALARHQGRLQPVAKELDVSVRTVQRAMLRCGLSRKTFRSRLP